MVIEGKMRVLVILRNMWAFFLGLLAVLFDAISVKLIFLGSAVGGGGKVSQVFQKFHSQDFLNLIDNHFIFRIKNLKSPYSQINADIFVLLVQDIFSKSIPKTFIEAGACDGLINSNTKYLENKGWTGILIEPAPNWERDLVKNRERAIIYKRALHPVSDLELDFVVSKDMQLSAFPNQTYRDIHVTNRKGNVVKVETISLVDVFRRQKENFECGYLSLDLEGFEHEILKDFFANCSNFMLPKIISVEHNFTKNRKLLASVLSNNSYIQVLSGFSGHDSWWIHEGILKDNLEQTIHEVKWVF